MRGLLLTTTAGRTVREAARTDRVSRVALHHGLRRCPELKVSAETRIGALTEPTLAHDPGRASTRKTSHAAVGDCSAQATTCCCP